VFSNWTEKNLPLDTNPDQFVWAQKYRPTKVDDCILPKELKDTFAGFLGRDDLPDMILVGPSGTGKTTVARAMLDELDVDYMLIPSSMQRGIDTIRDTIQGFASSVSFKGKRKFVILDEADNLTNDAQLALRNFMDQYASNCGFILTANYGNKLIPAMHSRTSEIRFAFPKAEAPALALAFFKRVEEILALENVKYEKAPIVSLVQKFYPDFRRIMNELQKYSATGKIDSGILTDLKAASTKEVVALMKDQNFTKIRQWAADHVSTNDDGLFYQDFYNNAKEYFKTPFIPQLVVLLAKYEYQSNFVFSKEINFVAFCVECMIEGETSFL
jgi:DNA polymerase III delta prime subunit